MSYLYLINSSDKVQVKHRILGSGPAYRRQVVADSR